MSEGTPIDMQSLTRLAKQFVDRQLYDEALQLFGVARRLDPKNLGIQLSLAQVRRMRRAAHGSPRQGVRQVVRENLRRSALDAKHFLGLAHLYADRFEDDKALENLAIAMAKDLSNPAPFKLRGKLQLRRHAFAQAVASLTTAWRYNPFDREVAEMLARARYECRELAGALEAYVDAFLLLSEHERERSHELQRRVQELKNRLEWSNEQLVELFHERQEHLRLSFERLELHRDELSSSEDDEEEDEETTLSRAGRLELATRLRPLRLWSHLTDEQIFLLTEAVVEEFRDRGQLVCSHGSSSYDLYLLEKGEATIQRPSAYGTIPLGLVKAGELLGEINFITRGERSGDVVATQSCELVRLKGPELNQLIRENPGLGVQLYWSFWHGLAFKLRCANEQLRTFFAEDGLSENLLRLRHVQPTTETGRFATVDLGTKVQVLREQGLTGEELMALATFSEERTYEPGTLLFQEGEAGREMFVVLEGKVRISKLIPGAGEEALAVLGRGDFFGEMSLIDGMPRSADARVHGDDPATVITLHQDTIREVLTMDPRASLKFLELLCRLVANRLREIDDKLVGWRIMSGQASAANG